MGTLGPAACTKDRTSLARRRQKLWAWAGEAIRERCDGAGGRRAAAAARTPTRWLLNHAQSGEPLCVSNAEMGHKADAVFDVCDRQIGALATAVIVRHLPA